MGDTPRIPESAAPLQQSQVEAIMEAIDESVLLLDESGHVIEANRVVADRVGVRRRDLVGSSVWAFLPEETVKERKAAFEKVLRTHAPVQTEDLREGKTYRTTWHPVLDGQGRVTQVAVFGRDITRRRQDGQVIDEKEALLRGVFESNPIGIALVDIETQRFLEANQSLCDILGYTEKELRALRVEDVTHPEDWEREQRLLRSYFDEEVSDYGLEKRYVRKDGALRWVRVNGEVLRVSEGSRPVALAMVEDISARREAEEGLRRSEETYRDLVEHINDVIFSVDLEGRITYVSPVGRDVLGFEPLELVGRPYVELIDPRDVESVQSAWRDILAGDLHPSEYRLIARSGEAVWVRTSSRPIFEKGSVIGVRGVLSNITGQMKAEEARKKSEDRFRSLFEGVPIGLYRTDLEGRIVAANSALLKMLGFPDLEGLRKVSSTRLMVRPEVQQEMRRILEERGHAYGYEFEVYRRDGSTIWVRDSARAIHGPGGQVLYEGSLEDITERKRAEEERKNLEAQLRQSQKMEAIGTLAGGIAHDFNNILAIIVGNAELAMLDLPEGSLVAVSLGEIHEACLRARDLVNQILLFAQRKEYTVSPVQVETIARESLRMLRASIPTTVEIHTEIGEDLPPVLADPSQIQQIIMNLCTNAAQAMKEQGGTLVFRLSEVEVDARLSTRTGPIAAGRYIRMAFLDTGPGIPSENLDRIFEPFFTTKEVGQGTGLGLAVVHGIVQERSGGMEVESEEDRGTTFTVYLPVSKGAEAAVRAVEEPALPRGEERVLFVDDEPMIAKLGQRMLERQGYEVETRTRATDALAAFTKDPDRFDLVVTDMTMPRMSGDRLAIEILAIRPDMPVILCTGYSAQISEERAREIGIRAFVMKPLTQSKLAHKVRRVLDGEPAGPH